MTQNPWNVDSIEAFTFLKCPECNFDSKEFDNFRDHGIENHPMSFIFFQKQLKEEPLDIKEENWELQGGYKRMAPHSIKIRGFFEIHPTLWDRIKLNKPILVKIRLQKVYLDEIWTQKVWGKFKNGSYFNTIGGLFFCTHPVVLICKHYLWPFAPFVAKKFGVEQ